jgi:four helix bundle protein
MALGSASETTYQLILAHDLGILDDDDHGRLAKQARELRMVLTSLARTLRSTHGSAC